MSQSAQIQVRIDPNIKAKAQTILQALGTDISGVVKMLMHQIVLLKRIPLSNNVKVQTIGGMTRAEIDAEVEDAIRNGKSYDSFSELWDEIADELKEEGHEV